jgi:hypothetical protein
MYVDFQKEMENELKKFKEQARGFISCLAELSRAVLRASSELGNKEHGLSIAKALVDEGRSPIELEIQRLEESLARELEKITATSRDVLGKITSAKEAAEKARAAHTPASSTPTGAHPAAATAPATPEAHSGLNFD